MLEEGPKGKLSSLPKLLLDFICLKRFDLSD